jgi:riboflavin synthase
MFTGIVTDLGTITQVQEHGPHLRRLKIACGYDPAGIDIGASIACQGVCLTVTALFAREDGVKGCVFQVETASETLAKTQARHWAEGTKLNLERSLKLGDELGGHLVTGHVDGIAQIVSVTAIEPVAGEAWSATARFDIRAPKELAGFIATKGSVCLDGTSLTVNSVTNDVFSVLLIPHTLAVTTWGERRASDGLHLEVDLMARYAARLAEARRS